MIKNDLRLIFWNILLLALSGAVLFTLDMWFEVQTEFGLRANPYISEAKLFHYICAFGMLFFTGKLYNSHIRVGIKNKKRAQRKTGLLLFICFITLACSGVLSLYLVSDAYIEINEYIHKITGVIFSLTFLIHFLKSRKIL